MSLQPIFVDVREHSEFETEHVEGSINIPLSRFSHIAPNFLAMAGEQTIYLMCHSGNRALQAIAIAKQMQLPHENLVCYQGGIMKWKKQGNATSVSSRAYSRLPLTRQAYTLIGALVVLFGVLGYWVSPVFSILAAVSGLGMLLASNTGLCVLSSRLAWMPGNRSSRSKLRC